MTTVEPVTIPAREEVESFAGRMLDVLNAAAVAYFASIGHQTGLFDTMAGMPPATSEQIANATALNERYVREWLAGLVTARVVEYDPDQKRYHLPPAHAAVLTRAAGPDNLAFFGQYIALCGTVEQQIIDCFRTGSGLTYAAYPRFQALQAEETGAVYDASLIARTIPSIPGLVGQLTAGIDVADIGCGSGHAVNLMARAFPASHFTGYDISAEGLAAARAEASAWGLMNARFIAQDAARLDSTDAYDFMTAFDTVHDQVAPAAVLEHIRRALRPGGTFLMVDIRASSILEENIEHPLGPAFYLISIFHCMTVSLAHGGEGLGTMWGEQRAREYLARAGFADIDIAQIEGDFLNSYYVCRG